MAVRDDVLTRVRGRRQSTKIQAPRYAPAGNSRRTRATSWASPRWRSCSYRYDPTSTGERRAWSSELTPHSLSFQPASREMNAQSLLAGEVEIGRLSLTIATLAQVQYHEILRISASRAHSSHGGINKHHMYLDIIHIHNRDRAVACLID